MTINELVHIFYVYIHFQCGMYFQYVIDIVNSISSGKTYIDCIWFVVFYQSYNFVESCLNLILRFHIIITERKKCDQVQIHLLILSFYYSFFRILQFRCITNQNFGLTYFRRNLSLFDNTLDVIGWRKLYIYIRYLHLDIEFNQTNNIFLQILHLHT